MAAPKKQKPAQKADGQAQKPKDKTENQEFSPGTMPRPDWCPAELWLRLETKQQIFLVEYLFDTNGTQAAIRAGYSDNPRSAAVYSSELLKNLDIAAVRDLGLQHRTVSIDQDSEMVASYWRMLATGDASELTEHRRVPCRFCYAEDHKYQYTPAEWEEAKDAWEKKREFAKSSEKPDPGEFKGKYGNWYDKRLSPNTECPECFGDGIGEVFLADTRYIPPVARAMFAGVKRTKEGIEMSIHTREKALEHLAKYRQMFKPVEDKNVDQPTRDDFEEYEKIIREAKDRQAAVNAERGITPESD